MSNHFHPGKTLEPLYTPTRLEELDRLEWSVEHDLRELLEAGRYLAVWHIIEEIMPLLPKRFREAAE